MAARVLISRLIFLISGSTCVMDDMRAMLGGGLVKAASFMILLRYMFILKMPSRRRVKLRSNSSKMIKTRKLRQQRMSMSLQRAQIIRGMVLKLQQSYRMRNRNQVTRLEKQEMRLSGDEAEQEEPQREEAKNEVCW